jgi:hypothetical protein
MKLISIGTPDRFGKYLTLGTWYDDNPAFCLTCGACASRKCACYDKNHIRGQYFSMTAEQSDFLTKLRISN